MGVFVEKLLSHIILSILVIQRRSYFLSIFVPGPAAFVLEL